MERVESLLFKANKSKVYADKHFQCFICGAKTDLNVHHFICQWANKDRVDFEALKEMCEIFDVYGYGEKMKELPITSIDDIRNLLVLCEGHHKRADHGIHNLTFADFMLQKVGEKKNDH